jgi:pimeloyl-ACP methyl ester carboxylesterase
MGRGHVGADGARLWYEREGEGFPVVLVHPGLWDARIWDGQFEEFARHHDTIRYDLRGHGRSDEPAGPYSDLRDLRRLLEDQGIHRCAVVGCGRGAQLAIDFALAHPEIAEAIVAVAPVLSGYRWSDPGLGLLSEEVDRAVRAGDAFRAMEMELAVWAPLSAGDPATNVAVREIAMDNAQVLCMDDSLLEQAPPAELHLGDVGAATLVVVGDDDLRETHAIADLIVRSVPGASKRVISDADQLVNVRRPDRFNRVVLDFLAFRM